VILRPPAGRRAAARTFAVFRTRNYALCRAGLVFYVLGHRAEYVAIAWITWEVGRDTLTLGDLSLAQGPPWSSSSSSAACWPTAPTGCGCWSGRRS